MSLDRQLAKTFRAARWVESDGKPVCAKCFDGADVRPGYRSARLRSELASWCCLCCHYHFGDASGTPIARTNRPLVLWAYVALGGTWETLKLSGPGNKWKREELRKMAKRLAGSATIDRWRGEMAREGLTVEQLAAQLRKRAGGLGEGRAA